MDSSFGRWGLKDRASHHIAARRRLIVREVTRFRQTDPSLLQMRRLQRLLELLRRKAIHGSTQMGVTSAANTHKYHF